jgi:hypothetical protein
MPDRRTCRILHRAGFSNTPDVQPAESSTGWSLNQPDAQPAGPSTGQTFNPPHAQFNPPHAQPARRSTGRTHNEPDVLPAARLTSRSTSRTSCKWSTAPRTSCGPYVLGPPDPRDASDVPGAPEPSGTLAAPEDLEVREPVDGADGPDWAAEPPWPRLDCFFSGPAASLTGPPSSRPAVTLPRISARHLWPSRVKDNGSGLTPR